MADNSFYHGGMTLVDITKDTVTADTLAKGVTAHDKDGNSLVGTMEGGGGDTSVETLINREDPVNVANTEYDRVMARGIYIGTTDMVDGVTELTSGVIYLVYS